MIKREKTRKNPKKIAARFARRQRGGGGSEALGRGVGGVVPPHPPPIGDACILPVLLFQTFIVKPKNQNNF